jgi:hypothetical protein
VVQIDVQSCARCRRADVHHAADALDVLSGREQASTLGNDPGQRLAQTGQQFDVLETHHPGDPLQSLDRLDGRYRRRVVRGGPGVVGVEPAVRDLAADVMDGDIVRGDEPPGLVTNSNGAGTRRARDFEVGQRSWSRWSGCSVQVGVK